MAGRMKRAAVCVLSRRWIDRMFGVPLHFLVVHFPIALAVLSAVCDAYGYFGNAPSWHETSYRLTGWAAVAASFAVLTGLQMGGGRFETSESIAHVATALVGTLSLISLAGVCYAVRARQEKEATERIPLTWLLLSLFAGIVIAMAALTGHRFALGL